MQGLARDRADVVHVQRLRRVRQQRMKHFVHICSRFMEGCEAPDRARNAFGAWRTLVGVAVVGRTCEQVCASLSDRVTCARQALQAERSRTVAAVLSSVQSSRGYGYAERLMTMLCFPAWRRHTEALRRRNHIILCEEDNLVRLQDVRRWGSGRQRRWGLWAAGGQPRAATYCSAIKVLKEWGLAVRSACIKQGISRAKVVGHNAFQGVIVRSSCLQRHCFVAWQRVAQEEAVQSLEARVRRLEAEFGQGQPQGLLLHLQLGEPSSSSSESEGADGLPGMDEQAEERLDKAGRPGRDCTGASRDGPFAPLSRFAADPWSPSATYPRPCSVAPSYPTASSVIEEETARYAAKLGSFTFGLRKPHI